MSLNISNSLSIFRLILTLPLAYSLWNDKLIWVLVIAIVASISDFLDGFFARKLNQITELGKILDPVADKTIVSVAGLILLIMGTLPIWFGTLVVLRDIFILSVGLYIKKRKSITMTANFLGKITVNVISIAIICSLFFEADIISYIYIFATIFIFASLLSYLLNAIKIWSKV